jgi:hypothetical protein
MTALGARTTRTCIGMFLIFFAACTGRVLAQSAPVAGHESGFVFYEALQGDSNSDGQALVLGSSMTYRFHSNFSVSAGVPIYFVRRPASLTGSTTSSWDDGVGDVFGVVRAVWRSSILNYGTALTGTAPTGSTQKGLSTGHATFDWDNRIDHRFGRLIPFADAGLANSVTDTSYFVRPFTTYGDLAHFEGGANVDLSHSLDLKLSAYDIVPWNNQTIISRVVPGNAVGNILGNLAPGLQKRVFQTAHETTGGASLTQDHGFIAVLGAHPRPYLDLALGYTRSVGYALNTVSFGVGVNLSELFGKSGKGT